MHEIFSDRGLDRDLSLWSKFNMYTHASIDDLRHADLQYGVHTVNVDGYPIDMLATPRKGVPLLITLHGNSPLRHTSHPPVFTGIGVVPKDMKISFLSISDPTLAIHPDVSLAWYSGCREMRAQAEIPRLISALIDNLHPSNVLFFGGSGGGFASLLFAHLIPDAGALVWNPQTCITDYAPQDVGIYAKSAWGIAQNTDDCFSGLEKEIITSLSADYADRDIPVLYLQNQSDWHVSGHMLPFFDRNKMKTPTNSYTGCVGGRTFLHLDNWGEGHAPPPKHALTSLLVDLLDADGAFWSGNNHDVTRIVKNAFSP